MKRKDYSTPTTELIELHTIQPLLLISGSGVPSSSSDLIEYPGVGGFFGPDEEVASRLFDGL